MSTCYGIAEWYGEPFVNMSSARRQELAEAALGMQASTPACPFQPNNPQCNKKGGVCSIQRYQKGEKEQSGEPAGTPVILCPHRFGQNNLVVRWLAEIVGFDETKAQIAKEVPFMQSVLNDKPAGRIDLVLAEGNEQALIWFGLEVQAVYFSGKGMQTEFEKLRKDSARRPPFPDAIRRPDWRSSGAKRLMPQLQIKVPTLRRWGTKLAVAVDRPFFDAIGGAGAEPSRDLDEGEIIWLISKVSADYKLQRAHWETLSLDASVEKLQAARTIKRGEFEKTLRAKLFPLRRY